jgi:hypothetical protein
MLLGLLTTSPRGAALALSLPRSRRWTILQLQFFDMESRGRQPTFVLYIIASPLNTKDPAIEGLAADENLLADVNRHFTIIPALW